MKGFWGLLVILVFYTVLGNVSNTSGFKEGTISIVYFILFGLNLISMVLVNKVSNKKILITWILLSTIPVAIFSLHSYFYTKWGGWDLGLWELIVPIIIVISQIIIIITSSLILIIGASKDN